MLDGEPVVFRSVLTLHQKREAIRRRDVLGETLADIVRSYNVSRSTISRQ
jgi:hypothetical protein